MSLQEVAELTGGQRRGSDRTIYGVSTDTRTLTPDSLFVALRGGRFDGHDFVPDAVRAGGALVERTLAAALPQVVVSDSQAALGQLASAWRCNFSAPLIGVTGSVGKTTVKEKVAACLATEGPTLATRGNRNNAIGVPLTLAELAPGQRAAVVELGANHPGEIAALAALARPTVGLITNAAAAHLEGFGSLEGVARAKGELLTALPADGVAVLNAEDPYLALWRELAGQRRVVTFGASVAADYRVDLEAWTLDWQGRPETQFELMTPAGTVVVSLPLLGRHQLVNAAAAAAAVLAAGGELAALSPGLGAMPPVPGRLEVKSAIGGGRLLDDTYNASPRSLQAALEVLATAPGERFLVLGDMAELGEEGAAFHQQAGQHARQAGVSRLFALGELAAQAAQAFGCGAQCFDEHEALSQSVQQALLAIGDDAAVLVKGSRSMGMERIVKELAGDARDEGS